MNAVPGHPFGLREPPFAVAPDPRFAYLAADAGDVLERIETDVTEGTGGITLLTGGNGSGKTLIAQCLLERLADRDVRVARVLHSRVTPVELLQSVCARLRVPMDGNVNRDSGRDLINALSTFLMDIYAQGQRVLLVVDEAQNLPDESLEQLRLLTNLETPVHRLMHILMLATPPLRERLRTAALEPLAQRITAWNELAGLDARHSEAYVRHRLAVAGAPPTLFTRLALREMHHCSRGVPRVLNLVGERALALAAQRGHENVGESVVQQATRDVLPGHVGYWLRQYRWWGLAGIVGVLILAGFAWWGLSNAPAPPTPAAPTVPKVSATQQAERIAAALPPARQARLQAWSTLLARWQVGSDQTSVEAASKCPAVIFAGFDCVGGTGTLDQLERFDRPLVLVLDTPDGKRQALLLGVGETQVRLDIGARDVMLTRPALAQLWHGRFYAPFRLPPSLPSILQRGDSGSAVAWLDRQLRQFDGDTSRTPGVATFDAAVTRRVKRLQRVFGIPDDGIVGPETLFALTSLDTDGPHLARDVP
ncbi:MAG TPA: AAA family ATPase [Oleiagrimonas sp.]|nr:AAA family ATPase [Oleiagrimonas sp.]